MNGLTRPQVVWLALVSSLTAIGGLLLALQPPTSARADGVALPALTHLGVASSEPVFSAVKSVDRERWRAIVIHHSGDRRGSAEVIAHQHERMGFRGLGHHFVIGNGRGMADGELHVGFRWIDQLPGAHAGGPDGAWYNHRAISICLVGNGDEAPFTDAQVGRLVELVTSLCRELSIPPERVLLHRQVAPTSDPGRFFPEAQFVAALERLR